MTGSNLAARKNTQLVEKFDRLVKDMSSIAGVDPVSLREAFKSGKEADALDWHKAGIDVSALFFSAGTAGTYAFANNVYTAFSHINETSISGFPLFGLCALLFCAVSAHTGASTAIDTIKDVRKKVKEYEDGKPLADRLAIPYYTNI